MKIFIQESPVIRKTVSLDENILLDLQRCGALERFSNFSELVSVALREKIEKIEEENYRAQIAAASKDPMVLEDIRSVEEDFRYADSEW